MEIKDYKNSINYPNQYLIELNKVNSVGIVTCGTRPRQAK